MSSQRKFQRVIRLLQTNKPKQSPSLTKIFFGQLTKLLDFAELLAGVAELLLVELLLWLCAGALLPIGIIVLLLKVVHVKMRHADFPRAVLTLRKLSHD